MTENGNPRIELRENPTVTRDMALCTTDFEARMLLAQVIESPTVEMVPMESSYGSLSFVTPVNGLGYTLSYDCEGFDDDEKHDLLRITDALVWRNESYDQKPREYPLYRITFCAEATHRMDPLDLVWLFSHNNVIVFGKSGTRLFVAATYRTQLRSLAVDMDYAFGTRVIERIEGAGRYGYEQLSI